MYGEIFYVILYQNLIPGPNSPRFSHFSSSSALQLHVLITCKFRHMHTELFSKAMQWKLFTQNITEILSWRRQGKPSSYFDKNKFLFIVTPKQSKELDCTLQLVTRRRNSGKESHRRRRAKKGDFQAADARRIGRKRRLSLRITPTNNPRHSIISLVT